MKKYKIAVVGLGYVGLPLSIEFGKKFDTFGFDISKKRISELMDGMDSTLEISKSELNAATKLSFTSSALSKLLTSIPAIFSPRYLQFNY